jgi:hypothetical protein
MMVVLVMLTMGMMFVPSASANHDEVVLPPGQYSSGAYIPGETVDITILGPASEVYDIGIYLGTTKKRTWNDQTANSDGELVLSYEIPDDAADGWYDIYICDSTILGDCDWSQDHAGNNWPWWWGFNVRLWEVDVETDKDGYVPGETVTVFYKAAYVKDKSIPDNKFGTITANDPSPTTIDSDDNIDYGLGVWTFKLSSSTTIGCGYDVYFYFNSSASSPDNYGMDSDSFCVGNLDANVGSISDTSPGSVVQASVFVRDDNQWDPIAGASVDLKVFEKDGTSWDEKTEYAVDDLVTDANGRVDYYFTLSSTIDDNTDYKVEAEVTYKGTTITDDEVFTIYVVGSLTVDLRLDKNTYLSDESITATAVVATSGTTATGITYTFEVRKNGNELLAQVVQTEDTFTYDNPDDNFEGQLWFRVTARNDAGVQDTETEWVSIVHGYVVVNPDRDEYNAGDTITVNYELVGPMTAMSPTYYYRVYGTFCFPPCPNPVESGETTGNSFEFTVPSVPPDAYTFEVIANAGGREVNGWDSASLVSRFFISIDLDRNIYSLGDTMKVTYEITARGNSVLPSFFTFNFGLSGGPQQDYQTTDASGEFSYKIPSSGMDEGTLLFSASEGSTGTAVAEVITVRGGNPLWWGNLAEIPAFDILLLILIIILFIMLLRMRKGPAPESAPEEEAPPMAPEGEATPPPPPGGATPAAAAAGASAFTTPCKACGAPIEITTSKRPIEVMCPSCGDTQMVT